MFLVWFENIYTCDVKYNNGLHSFLAFYILQYTVMGVFWIMTTILYYTLGPARSCHATVV
jgi:hypothetical protein